MDAGEVCTTQHFRVWYSVLPLYPEQSAETGQVKVVELSRMSTVDSPGFAAIQKSCEDHGAINLQLGRDSDSSTVPYIVC